MPEVSLTRNLCGFVVYLSDLGEFAYSGYFGRAGRKPCLGLGKNKLFISTLVSEASSV